MFFGWEMHPYAWCGNCPAPRNAMRFVPKCVTCHCPTSPAFYDVRVVIYDDRYECFRQVVMCDQCHYRFCERFWDYRPTLANLRAIAAAPQDPAYVLG